MHGKEAIGATVSSAFARERSRSCLLASYGGRTRVDSYSPTGSSPFGDFPCHLQRIAPKGRTAVRGLLANRRGFGTLSPSMVPRACVALARSASSSALLAVPVVRGLSWRLEVAREAKDYERRCIDRPSDRLFDQVKDDERMRLDLRAVLPRYPEYMGGLSGAGVWCLWQTTNGQAGSPIRRQLVGMVYFQDPENGSQGEMTMFNHGRASVKRIIDGSG